MPARWRLGFLTLAILAPVFLIAWTALADADWQSCFASYTGRRDGSSPYDNVWRTVRAALLPPPTA